MYICAYICIDVGRNIDIDIDLSIYIYICIYIYVYVYICIFIYLQPRVTCRPEFVLCAAVSLCYVQLLV